VRAFTQARRVAPAPIAPYQRGWIYLFGVLVLPLINFFGAPPWIASYYAPSGSNIPTILVGDRFFVEVGYYRAHAPRRGEMIVFISPRDGHTIYVKRLVGLSGETIQLREGKLYIAGQAVPLQQIEDYSDRSDGAPTPMHQYVETLPGGASYRVLRMGDDGPLDNTPVFDVPAGHYFTLGDNRGNSLDSRSLSQIGYVPAANLIGHAYIVYWPLSRLGLKFD
jgi:signal peptidase I